jgi:MarR family transcriptional regulator, organic hydroperoxide resistance regulator
MIQPDLPDLSPLSHAIFRVARAHKSLAGRLLREAGLHPGQELLLMTLWVSGPQRMIDLAAAIESDAPSMTRSITRLEHAGLVSRRRSPSDGRVVIVEATEASLALRAKVEQAWVDLERFTVGSLTTSQQAEVLDALSLLEGTIGLADR